ncbi:MAG: hypothetical protein [Caudoviricetes sp.]|nr:MAG: hypothetical protein [Caudoviricetes sp.]
MTIVNRNYSIHEIEEWARDQQEKIRAKNANAPGLSEIEFVVQPGKKNVRVVKYVYGQGSVWCFIEMATGNILKAAGFKAPAKGARGHISENRVWDWNGSDWYC